MLLLLTIGHTLYMAFLPKLTYGHFSVLICMGFWLRRFTCESFRIASIAAANLACVLMTGKAPDGRNTQGFCRESGALDISNTFSTDSRQRVDQQGGHKCLSHLIKELPILQICQTKNFANSI